VAGDGIGPHNISMEEEIRVDHPVKDQVLRSFGMRKVFVVVNFLNAIFGIHNGWLPPVFLQKKMSEMLLYDIAWKYTSVTTNLESGRAE